MNVLVVFGTRPEAIKMAPLLRELRKADFVSLAVCVSGQHRQMLDQVLELFDIVPDFDLQIMAPGQSLNEITMRIMSGMDDVIDAALPDIVLVHGDTSTTFAAALAAFQRRIAIGHVEAGLRTGNIHSPWPEEANRRLTGVLADLHFAPTETARQNLEQEGVSPRSIIVTGNTVLDAVYEVRDRLDSDLDLRSRVDQQLPEVPTNSRILLVTGHRRENFGEGFENMCSALKTLALRFPSLAIVFPVHLNPKVSEPVKRHLEGLSNIYLIRPLEYLPFVRLMDRSSFLLTDSGGVQEEATALGKTVLVMREHTERWEPILSGKIRLVGTDEGRIVNEVCTLMESDQSIPTTRSSNSPYGDGRASARILECLMDWSREHRL